VSIPVDGRERRLDLRLVPAALTSWVMTAAGILWSVTGVVVAAISVAVAASAAAWWGSRPHRSDDDARMTAAAATAILLTGLTFGIAVLLRVDHASSHPLTERYGDVGAVIVTPSESPRSVGGSRVMFRGALGAVDAVEMSGSVVVFASDAGFAGITVGQPAAFTARISRPNRRDLTVAALSATGQPTLGDAAPIQRAGQRVRDEFSRTARDALPADQAAMLPALVLGDTSALPAETVKQFRLSGLTHLTAVSGANVTIVCGAVLLTAAVVGPGVAVALAGTALVAFVIIVQPSASVLRAAVMAAITLLALVTHRRRQAIPVLSAAVIALMIAAPELAVDIGFALSVSATAALVVVAPAWSRRLVARGWPKPLADALSVAVAAQLVTAPLVAAISGTFSVVAVVANLAAAIVVVPITVIGTAAAGLAVVWPAGADLLIRFTGPELWWLLTVARCSAGVPGASLPVPDGISGALTVFAVGAGAFLALRWCRRRVSARHDTI
jgi:competence protein ComEC